MKTIKTILLSAVLVVSAAAFADITSYILYWTATYDSYTSTADKYYAAIGIGTQKADGTYSSYVKGENGNIQLLALDTKSATTAAGITTYSGGNAYGYVDLAEKDSTFTLAIFDSSYNVVTTLDAASKTASDFGTSFAGYDPVSQSKPTSAYGSNGGGFSATAVPEPTSGLLMLLGLAGLALRRPSSRKRYAVTGKRA